MGSSAVVPPIAHFAPELMDRLYSLWEDNAETIGDWSIHRVFTYWAAALLDNTDPDFFTYSDGADDRGIDFFTAADHAYTVLSDQMPRRGDARRALRPRARCSSTTPTR